MHEGNQTEMVAPGPNTPVPAGTLGTVRGFTLENGWEIAWENGISTFFPGDAGDEIANRVPPGTLGVCDFCSSPEPRWEHRCHDNESVMIAVGSADELATTMGAGSLGSWAACDPCHDLIEAGSRDELARRAARRIGEQSGLPADLTLAATRQAHRQYWEFRVGPGFPIREANA
jgi:hypothetical protein